MVLTRVLMCVSGEYLTVCLQCARHYARPASLVVNRADGDPCPRGVDILVRRKLTLNKTSVC